MQDRKLNPSGIISKFPAGNYNIDVLGQKITNLFLKLPYDGLIAETNSTLGQLVLENIGGSRIGLDQDFAELLETEQTLPLMKITQRVIKTTAYFIHCDLIDGINNLFNGKRSNILAKFDITGKPYEKVRYDTSLQFPFRDCSTDSHVNSITLTVRDQVGEKNGWTRDRQTMSVTSIHNLIYAVLLAAGNVIGLQPTALNTCTFGFAVLFFFKFPLQSILFYIIAAEESCMHECCILFESSFF